MLYYMSDLEKLESFLINNSDISKEFINDFFGFQKKKLYEEYKPFTINLEDVAYWLETLKTRLKETLVSNYSKNIDYLIVKNLLSDSRQQDATHGGHNKKIQILENDLKKEIQPFGDICYIFEETDELKLQLEQKEIQLQEQKVQQHIINNFLNI